MCLFYIFSICVSHTVSVSLFSFSQYTSTCMNAGTVEGVRVQVRVSVCVCVHIYSHA